MKKRRYNPNPDAAWIRAHPEFCRRVSPKPVESPKTRLLRVQNDYFTAGAVWRQTGPKCWQCVEAAPIIRWMVGMNQNQVPTELLKRGCKWEWLS